MQQVARNGQGPRRFLAVRVGSLIGLLIVAVTGLKPTAPGASPARPSAPSSWELPGTGTWLAAGDSYSSGQGIQERRGDCARSFRAYGPLAFDRTVPIFRIIDPKYAVERTWNLQFTACKGDVADRLRMQLQLAWNVWDALPPRACAQMLQDEGLYAAIKEDHIDDWFNAGCDRGEHNTYDVITLTFGGNDLGFPRVAKGCNEYGRAVDAAGDTWTGLRTSVDWNGGLARAVRQQNLPVEEPLTCPTEEELTKRVQRLKRTGIAYGDRAISYHAFVQEAASHLAPGGQLFVLGYPKLFAESEEWGFWEGRVCHGTTKGTANKLGRVAVLLNSVMRDEVTKAAKLDRQGRIHYVPVVDKWKHHELCGNRADWINGASASRGASFHPNSEGNDAEAELLEAQLARYSPAGRAVTSTTTTPTPTNPDLAVAIQAGAICLGSPLAAGGSITCDSATIDLDGDGTRDVLLAGVTGQGAVWARAVTTKVTTPFLELEPPLFAGAFSEGRPEAVGDLKPGGGEEILVIHGGGANARAHSVLTLDGTVLKEVAILGTSGGTREITRWGCSRAPVVFTQVHLTDETLNQPFDPDAVVTWTRTRETFSLTTAGSTTPRDRITEVNLGGTADDLLRDVTQDCVTPAMFSP